MHIVDIRPNNVIRKTKLGSLFYEITLSSQCSNLKGNVPTKLLIHPSKESWRSIYSSKVDILMIIFHKYSKTKAFLKNFGPCCILTTYDLYL